MGLFGMVINDKDLTDKDSSSQELRVIDSCLSWAYMVHKYLVAGLVDS